ncbi:hypothetical protein [uncultured Dokdonia sp.]|uniref:hypothetical protein n=1 Tax=uncultured Dokdonia sp. TaxID=575653 RepID=UPI002638C57C|nr:hypothetical protein [uncultured Dokdonia sp.]
MKRLIVCVFGVLLFYSCEDILSVPDISEDLITLIAPTDDAVLENPEVTFTWEEIEFADQYQIQVATPNFAEANQVVLDTILGDSLQSFRSFTTNLISSNYQWRVRGLNDNFQTDYTTQSFEVDTPNTEINLSDQMVTILAPEDNFETSETMIQLSWEEIEEASIYRIIITNTADNSFFLEQTTTDTEITIEFVSGMYTWEVRGENESQNTPYTQQTITIL